MVTIIKFIVLGLHIRTLAYLESGEPKPRIKSLIKNSKLNTLIDNFPNLKVCVIGDLIIDEYITCQPLGMSQEDPTIVVSPIENNGVDVKKLSGKKTDTKYLSSDNYKNNKKISKQYYNKDKMIGSRKLVVSEFSGSEFDTEFSKNTNSLFFLEH